MSDYQIAHKKHYYIVPESIPFLLIGVILASIAGYFYIYASIPFIAFTFFVLYFFRNPNPKVPNDPKAVICPGEGKIIKIEKVEENRFLNQTMNRISIFLSPLNVHTNRIPMNGKITNISYNKGKYFAAYADKASLDNEQNAMILENEFNDKIIFIQIAGWLARRIVCYAKKDQMWKAGTLFGLIRFGSRVDVYLPLDYEITVKIGDKVTSGETILAKAN